MATKFRKAPPVMGDKRAANRVGKQPLKQVEKSDRPAAQKPEMKTKLVNRNMSGRPTKKRGDCY